MATYAELYGLRNNSELQNKIAVAVVIEAETLLSGTPTAAEAAWAKSVVSSPSSAAKSIINLVLAANKSVAAPAILTATDAAIQSNVSSIINGLILAEG